jgi:hypothetical protein
MYIYIFFLIVSASNLAWCISYLNAHKLQDAPRDARWNNFRLFLRSVFMDFYGFHYSFADSIIDWSLWFVLVTALAVGYFNRLLCMYSLALGQCHGCIVYFLKCGDRIFSLCPILKKYILRTVTLFLRLCALCIGIIEFNSSSVESFPAYNFVLLPTKVHV